MSDYPAYQPRSSVVPDGMNFGDFLEDVLMPHWEEAGATEGVRFFLSTLWWFHPSGSTFVPMRRIAARMGSDPRVAERAQAWAVEHGLLVVTKEAHRKTTRTVRTLVLPAPQPVDNYTDSQSVHPPEEGGAYRLTVGRVPTHSRSRTDCESGPSKALEAYEATHAADSGYPQDDAHTPFLDELVVRPEYLALRYSVKGVCRDYLRGVIEDDPVWCAVEGPQVVADKVLAEFYG